MNNKCHPIFGYTGLVYALLVHVSPFISHASYFCGTIHNHRHFLIQSPRAVFTDHCTKGMFWSRWFLLLHWKKRSPTLGNAQGKPLAFSSLFDIIIAGPAVCRLVQLYSVMLEFMSKLANFPWPQLSILQPVWERISTFKNWVYCISNAKGQVYSWSNCLGKESRNCVLFHMKEDGVEWQAFVMVPADIHNCGVLMEVILTWGRRSSTITYRHGWKLSSCSLSSSHSFHILLFTFLSKRISW